MFAHFLHFQGNQRLRFPDDSSVDTGELLLALSDMFTILWKSLSCSCLILFHPSELHRLELTRDGKEIVFIWLLVLWALEEILLQTLLLRMPSIATSRMSFHNKLHEVFPQLNDCISCPRSNSREETLISRLHIGHSYITRSFFFLSLSLFFIFILLKGTLLRRLNFVCA